MARTTDERIVFQNQSHLVQKYFNDCGVCPSLLDIANATDLMVEYAINGPTTEVKQRFKKFDEYLNKLKNNKI